MFFSLSLFDTIRPALDILSKKILNRIVTVGKSGSFAPLSTVNDIPTKNMRASSTYKYIMASASCDLRDVVHASCCAHWLGLVNEHLLNSTVVQYFM